MPGAGVRPRFQLRHPPGLARIRHRVNGNVTGTFQNVAIDHDITGYEETRATLAPKSVKPLVTHRRL